MEFTFKNLTEEEQGISNEFFKLIAEELPNTTEIENKFNAFFALFLEICHQRDFNPDQLKLEFDEQ